MDPISSNAQGLRLLVRKLLSYLSSHWLLHVICLLIGYCMLSVFLLVTACYLSSHWLLQVFDDRILLVDPTQEEESVCHGRITVVTTGEDNLCQVQPLLLWSHTSDPSSFLPHTPHPITPASIRVNITGLKRRSSAGFKQSQHLLPVAGDFKHGSTAVQNFWPGVRAAQQF